MDDYYIQDYSQYVPEENPWTDEEIEELLDKEYREEHNINNRDENGRLKKGAVIARKRSCDEDDIWFLYKNLGRSVKEIIELRGCSKSTVYNVISKREQELLNSQVSEESQLTDEEVDALSDKEYKKFFDIGRDERGRIKKGAVIARKRSCDEDDIWFLYKKWGLSVKEIVEERGCSKSTVYNVIKKYKKKEGDT